MLSCRNLQKKNTIKFSEIIGSKFSCRNLRKSEIKISENVRPELYRRNLWKLNEIKRFQKTWNLCFPAEVCKKINTIKVSESIESKFSCRNLRKNEIKISEKVKTWTLPQKFAENEWDQSISESVNSMLSYRNLRKQNSIKFSESIGSKFSWQNVRKTRSKFQKT